MTGRDSIRDVILFPTMKPEQKEKVKEKNQNNGNNVKESNTTVAKKTESGEEPICKDCMIRVDAVELLDKHIKPECFKHMYAAEAGMRAVAKKLEQDVDVWGITGLLHDLDYDEVEGDPKRHGLRAAEILIEAGVDESIIYAIKSHNPHLGLERKSLLDKALFAVDGLTGLIIAASLVRPDKDLQEVKVKSVVKKFKDKSFARAVSRDEIRTCETELGIELRDFIELVLEGMKSSAELKG